MIWGNVASVCSVAQPLHLFEDGDLREPKFSDSQCILRCTYSLQHPNEILRF